jgi:hypothetical protein
LCHFYKIVNKYTAPYLADLLPKLIGEWKILYSFTNCSKYYRVYM